MYLSPDRIILSRGLQGKQDLLSTHFSSLVLLLVYFVMAETHAF